MLQTAQVRSIILSSLPSKLILPQHFVVISSANDTPQASAAGTGAPASEASALPSPQLGALPKEKPLQPSASSTAMQAGPTRASTRKAKQEAQAALSVKPTPATATHGSDESSNESNSAAAATTGRVTRSKSAALKKSDSEVSDSASPTLKSPSSKKKKGTKSKKA